MKNIITIYHGSEVVVDKPRYGMGKENTDYGRGFYCTEDIELAKEWACKDGYDGYANVYSLDTSGLSQLNLNELKYPVLHWLSVLLKNRVPNITEEQKKWKDYITDNFPVNTKKYDIIRGYRVDGSYFRFAREFIQNKTTIDKLAQALKLGDLGDQVFIRSKEAFGKITFVGSEKASKDIYFERHKERDLKALNDYNGLRCGGLYLRDIIREGLKADDDDSRLR